MIVQLILATAALVIASDRPALSTTPDPKIRIVIELKINPAIPTVNRVRVYQSMPTATGPIRAVPQTIEPKRANPYPTQQSPHHCPICNQYTTKISAWLSNGLHQHTCINGHSWVHRDGPETHGRPRGVTTPIYPTPGMLPTIRYQSSGTRGLFRSTWQESFQGPCANGMCPIR